MDTRNGAVLLFLFWFVLGCFPSLLHEYLFIFLKRWEISSVNKGYQISNKDSCGELELNTLIFTFPGMDTAYACYKKLYF